MKLSRMAAALAATGLITLTIAACSDDMDHGDMNGMDGMDGDRAGISVPESEDFNAADVQFATDMIQHHAQALVMVDLVDDREVSTELAALAEQIRAAQVSEIELMVDWLTAWDQSIPETVRDHVNGGHGDDHGDMGMDGMDDMPGMMSADDMADLADASAAEFEDLWLEMMIEHHEGAVEMSEDELDDGEDAAALDLAQAIIDAQEAEIEQMKQMLD